MQFVRKSLLGGVASLLFAMLAVFGFSFGLLQVFGNADSVKSALERSGIYHSVVEAALTQAQAGQGEPEPGSLPLDRPEVQNIIKTAASPELLQAKTENVLDAMYAWIRGETPELAFSLEVGDVKAGLANGIEQYAAQYVASLPVCAPGAAADVSGDLFNATCRPEGADPTQLAAQAKNDFLNGEAFKETTFAANTIKVDGNKTLAQKMQAAPNIYRSVTWGVYGSGLLALLLAVGVVLLSVTWRTGLKKVAVIFIVVGALGVVASLLVDAGMNRVVEMAKEPLQQSAAKVAETLLGDLRGWWLGYGIVLAAAGIATLVVLRLTKPAPGPTETTGSDMPESTGEALPSKTPPIPASSKPIIDKPRPKPAKKLVQ